MKSAYSLSIHLCYPLCPYGCFEANLFWTASFGQINQFCVKKGRQFERYNNENGINNNNANKLP